MSTDKAVSPPLPEAVREQIAKWRDSADAAQDRGAIGEACSMREICDAWEAAAQQERALNDWQPIETAPAGEQIWAWDDARGSNPAMFVGGVWFITYDDAVIQPTHWQPLPGPPAVASHPPPTPEAK